MEILYNDISPFFLHKGACKCRMSYKAYIGKYDNNLVIIDNTIFHESSEVNKTVAESKNTVKLATF